MSRFSFSHLPDAALLRHAIVVVSRDCATTAEMLAVLAEIDTRKLYLGEGYPSMFAYCVEVLHMSEDIACKRIRAARAARDFPGILPAVADGCLHLTAVVMLAPHLTPENVGELLAAAAGKRSAELEELLAARCPRSESLPLTRAIPASAGPALASDRAEDLKGLSAVRRITVTPRAVVPIAEGRFDLHVTIGREPEEDLRYAQALMGDGTPSDVVALGLRLAVQELEKRKLGSSSRPRRSTGHPSTDPRHIPNAVKREVWQRDGAQCAFVSGAGHRCTERAGLEFDHIDPVACGGAATVDNLRLLCRAHNQYAADCAFGAEFMNGKREAAKRRNEKAAAEEEKSAAQQAADEVLPWLSSLGIRGEMAKNAAAACESIPEAPLEERIRVALKTYGQSRFVGLRSAPA